MPIKRDLRIYPGFIIALALSLLAGPGAWAKSIELVATPVPLNADAPDQRRVGKLIYKGGIEITSPNKNFGGLSGVLVDGQGQRLLAVTDKGYWLRAMLRHDADGNLVGLGEAKLKRLRDVRGKSLSGKRRSDSEAIERSRDGILVSFERDHRIWRYRSAGGLPKGSAEPVSLPPGIAGAPDNGGLEAIIELNDGRLLIVTEGWRNERGDLRGWLGAGAAWSNIRYAVTEGFAPTDFSLLPTGDLLVLERHYSVLTGPAARLQIIAGDAIFSGARLEGRELAVIRWPLTVDNMEGVSAVKKADGVYLYMISDNNFSMLQRTLLLLFKIAED